GFSDNRSFTYHDFDYATVAYSNEGTPLWINRYGGNALLGEFSANNDYAGAIAADSRGNVFVTGHSQGNNGDEYATVAYSGAGLPLWTNRYHGMANGGNLARAVGVDSS